jgi:maleamate amidohydrolase
MAEASSDELRFFKERGFGKEMGFGERPALLVIDILRAFTDASMPLGANLDAQIEQINILLDATRGTGIPVFFSIVCYEEADCLDAGVWGRKMSGLFGLTAGSPAVELDPRLRRQARDSVFIKKYASCFFGTDLASRLQSRRVDTLIITGCTTSGCVRASAVDAVQHGFRPIVAREAVGDRSAPAHDQSLFDIQAKYGDVKSVSEIVGRLRQPDSTQST